MMKHWVVSVVERFIQIPTIVYFMTAWLPLDLGELSVQNLFNEIDIAGGLPNMASCTQGASASPGLITRTRQ